MIDQYKSKGVKDDNISKIINRVESSKNKDC